MPTRLRPGWPASAARIGQQGVDALMAKRTDKAWRYPSIGSRMLRSTPLSEHASHPHPVINRQNQALPVPTPFQGRVGFPNAAHKDVVTRRTGEGSKNPFRCTIFTEQHPMMPISQCQPQKSGTGCCSVKAGRTAASTGLACRHQRKDWQGGQDGPGLLIARQPDSMRYSRPHH